MRVVCLFMSLIQIVNAEQRGFLCMRVNYSNYSSLIITRARTRAGAPCALWWLGKLSRWSALLCLILGAPAASAWQMQVLIKAVNSCRSDTLTDEDGSISLDVVHGYLTTCSHKPRLLSMKVQHSRTLIRVWHLITPEGKFIFNSQNNILWMLLKMHLLCSYTIIFNFTDID